MLKLLRANFFRLRKDKPVWAAGIVTLVYALGTVLMFVYAKSHSEITVTSQIMEFVYIGCYGFAGLIAVPGILMATVCGVCLGKEFHNGTIRNKIVAGRSRTEIYFANFLTAAAIGIAMNALYFIPAFALGMPLLGGFHQPAEYLVWVAVDGTFMMLAYAAVFNALVMLSRNMTAATVLGILGVVVFMFVSQFMINRLQEPEFIYYTASGVDFDESGMVPNPKYLGDTARAVVQFFVNLFPSGQSMQISKGDPFQDWQMLLCSLGVIAAANVTGALVFRKIDLK